MFAAGLSMFASCQEYEIDSQPELPPTIYVSALDKYSIAAESPSRIVFNISSNTPWIIETDSQWCIPTPATSAESSLVSEIVINPADNDVEVPRSAKLKITAEALGLVKEITIVQAKMREQVTLSLAEDPKGNVVAAGTGLPCDTIVKINSSKPWVLSDSDLPEWLSLEKLGETELKVTTTANNLLSERTAGFTLQVQGDEELFEFPFKVVQPAPIRFSNKAVVAIDDETGYAHVTFTKGEMFRTDYLINKGRYVIEFEEMKMSARCNLGFVFLGTVTDANFKFHMEDTYWFRCAGAFTWIAPIKKAYTFDEINAIRKLEFVITQASEGLVDISIYINGELYGKQAGRTDVFANGEKGCVFIFETGMDPAAGDYCVIKSITYINE